MVIAKSALEGNALCVEAAVDYLLQLKSLGIGGIFARLTIFVVTVMMNISYPRDPAAHVGTRGHRQPDTGR